MSQQQPPKSGNGWLIAGAALFVGYWLGQESGAPTKSYAETAPPPIITPAATPTDTAMIPAARPAADATALAEALDMLGNEAPAETVKTEFAATSYGYAPGAAAGESESGENPFAKYANAPDSDAAAATTGSTATASGPWTAYQSDPLAPAPQPSTYTYTPPATYTPPVAAYSGSSTKCEGLGCYGVISETTGRPRTTYVRGYTRKDGTYVQPHYRSRRRN